MKEPETIEDLKPAGYNPRRIDDGNALALRESMKRFGDVGGITFNSGTGRLVCGHQRVDQLRKAGAQMVRGALQIANGERFPVRIVDWDEETEKAANISANNPHLAGVYTEGLDALLRGLLGSMGDAEFEALRLDALLKEYQATAPPDAGDWADIFDERGDTSAVDGTKSVTFIVPEGSYELLMRHLKTLDKDKNKAIVKWLDLVS